MKKENAEKELAMEMWTACKSVWRLEKNAQVCKVATHPGFPADNACYPRIIITNFPFNSQKCLCLDN